jgi:hypothetical protein
MNEQFLSALASVKAPPCEKFSCPRRGDCAEKELACESFHYYVRTGLVVHPAMVFEGRKNGVKPSNRFQDAPEPTAGIFASL